jgi:hypothetical protein
VDRVPLPLGKLSTTPTRPRHTNRVMPSTSRSRRPASPPPVQSPRRHPHSAPVPHLKA